MQRLYALLIAPLLALAILFGPIDGPAEAQTHGINISGLEYSQGNQAPRPEAIAYYAKKGLCDFRIPVSIENMQPSVDGALDPAMVKKLSGTLAQITSLKCRALIDIHNYGRRNGAVMTDPGQFFRFMRLMVTTFHAANVGWGIQNEPHDQDGEAWVVMTNAGILAVRNVDWNAQVVVGLPEWSGIYAWSDASNPIWHLASLVFDPSWAPLTFDVHTYFDPNGSGQTTQVVPGVLDKVKAATAIAQQRGIKLVMTEIGFASDAISVAAGKSVIAYVNANPGVWGGWYYWAGGGWWSSSYVYLLDPAGNAWDASTWAKPIDKPQMAALLP